MNSFKGNISFLMVFKKGWLSRLNCINYGSLTLNKKGKDKVLNFTDV